MNDMLSASDTGYMVSYNGCAWDALAPDGQCVATLDTEMEAWDAAEDHNEAMHDIEALV